MSTLAATPEQIAISDFYKPWPHQISFHTNPAKNRLQIGGQGSGKSRPLLMEAIFHALEYPGSNSLILRKTIPDLKRTVIDKFLSDVPRALYQSYNKSDHIVYFHPDPKTGAQSKLYLHACERDEDVGRFLSSEYVFIGFEELGEFTFAQWDAITSRNRCTIPGSRPCVAAATNPMGIGWAWIKRLFIEKRPVQGMDEDKYDPNDYWYVHSTVENNPLLFADKEYVRKLEASPLRNIIRYGKLDTVSGQYFDIWQPARHVQPASAFVFSDWQSHTIGWDYGFGHYAVITWLTKAMLKPQPKWGWMTPRTVNVFVRERVLHEATPKEQSEALIASIPRTEDGTGYRETVDSIHLSWERFNRTVSDYTVAKEIGDYMQAAGLPFPTSSNRVERIAGWTKMYTLLDIDELFVLQGECPNLEECIPLAVRDPVKLEDVVKPKGLSLVDDVCESARYNVAGALLDPDEKPGHLKKHERLMAIKDPIARATQQYRDYLQEQKEARTGGQKQITLPSWRARIQNK